jgi:hypothetical protein
VRLNILAMSISGAVVGCVSGGQRYAPPALSPAPTMSVTISQPRAEVWKSLGAMIGKSFFVINNLEPTSGIISVTYAGDPEKYVDCGRVTQVIKTPNGDKTYEFAGAAATTKIPAAQGIIYGDLERTMALEGRANLVVEELAASSSKVSINVRYVLTRKMTFFAHPGVNSTVKTASFDSGGSAEFDPGTAANLTCRSNGAFETALLNFASAAR